MATAVHSQSQTSISSAGSNVTLDIQDVLSTFTGESLLLSTRLSFSQLSDSPSSQSFDDVPPFPARFKPSNNHGQRPPSPPFNPPSAKAAPTSFVSDVNVPRRVITLPTAPRLKTMLMEKISVREWSEHVSSSADLKPPPKQFVSVSPPGTSVTATKGTLVSVQQDVPARNSSLGRSDESRSSRSGNIPTIQTASTSIGSAKPLPGSLSGDSAQSEDIYVGHFVPTIMVSNSLAALPLSLESESSDNLHHEVSLAIRRGKNPPPALSLGLSPKQGPSDPYPDIPSAFLGSPTSYSPATPAFSYASGDPSKYNMGLSAMCNSLKALVPAPPFTPTDEESPSRPKLEPETRWGMVNSAQLPEVDDEEWAFAQDLIVDWHASKGLRAEISPPPSPAGDLPYTAVVSPATTEFSMTSVPALSECPSDDGSDREPESVQTPASLKQMRRKTVIIQAPECDSNCSIGRVDSIGKPSPTADRSDLLPDEFDEPVPFETPASTSSSTVSTQITSSSSRLSNTGTVKLPVRGILKEKKSVRFSAVPSLHEYSLHGLTSTSGLSDSDNVQGSVAVSGSGTPSRQLLDPSVPPHSGVRRTLTATPLKSSPLREAHSPNDMDMAVKLPVVPASSIPAPATAPLPPAPLFISGNTMAKHPAVRAMVRRPKPSRCPLPNALLGSKPPHGVDSDGVPPAQPSAPTRNTNTNEGITPLPTPVLLEEQRRAPMRSLNTRQTLPKRRGSDALLGPLRAAANIHKTAGAGAAKENAAAAARTTSAVPSPSSSRQLSSPTKREKENGNAGGSTAASAGVRRPERIGLGRGREVRNGGVAAGMGGQQQQQQRKEGGSSSRMPVPKLRSIFTKLRT